MVYRDLLRGDIKEKKMERWSEHRVRMEGLVKRFDFKREGRNAREIWKETELSLVSGVKLNRKRDDKGDMERERFVCFFTTLCGMVISWEEVGEMVGLFFSFCSFLGICFSMRFLQTNCLISPSLPPASPSPLLSLSLSRLFPPWDGNLKLSSLALLPRQ